jgi:sulfide dehydrogenase cytochrome subunit
MRKLIIAGMLLVALIPAHAEEKNPFIEKVFKDPSTYAKDPEVSGKMLGDNCDACHGTQGRIYDEVIPALAGIPKDTFIKIMMDFKKEVKPAIIMNHVARAFTDGEIERMAVYFASQPATPWLEKEGEKK